MSYIIIYMMYDIQDISYKHMIFLPTGNTCTTCICTNTCTHVFMISLMHRLKTVFY